MIREIVQLQPRERELILQAAKLLQPEKDALAKDWCHRWEERHKNTSKPKDAPNFSDLVDLFLLSLTDGDFSAYFDRIEARGADLAHTQRDYEEIVLSFHLFEDAASPYLRACFPDSMAEVTSALDHLYHNDIALLSRAYFHEIEQERERFYHILTHDLKNSLTSLTGCTELLQSRLDKNACDGYCRELLTDIRRASGKIEDQIDSALTYGRLKNGTMELQQRSIDMEQLIFEAISDLQRQALEEEKQIYFQGAPIGQWTPEEESPLPLVSGDDTLLYRAAANYLTNALKYAQKTIQVHLEQIEGSIRLCVCDDGTGIDPQYHQRVFEDYFQVPGSQPGTGLGLPSVRRIVELHLGDVGVEAANGEGSCFWLTLPVVD